MLYSEEKKDWIMVDWQGKIKFIWKCYFPPRPFFLWHSNLDF